MTKNSSQKGPEAKCAGCGPICEDAGPSDIRKYQRASEDEADGPAAKQVAPVRFERDSTKAHHIAVTLIVLYALIMLAPIAWMLVTSTKTPADTVTVTPGIIPSFDAAKPAPYHFRITADNFADQFRGTGNNSFLWPLLNSVIVTVSTTIAAVALGALAGYGFSRFKIAGSKDWQFFILSTRMLPALAVSVPIAFMYRKLGLFDTHLGLIILYTCFNLSFSTWMMKAFFDEIPTASEEAALLDGYTRFQVMWKVVMPQATTGLLATAVFAMIAAWNEYAFAVTLAPLSAKTLPVHLAGVAADPGEIPYGRLAAGALLFMLPIVIFSIVMRKHLLRGVTFGAVKG